MYSLLTPNEARWLNKQLGWCDKILKDPVLLKGTNIIDYSKKIHTKLNFYTDPFLNATVYSVPGVVAPTQ